MNRSSSRLPPPQQPISKLIMTTTRIESRLDTIEQNQETLRAEIAEFREIFKEVQDAIRDLAGMVSASSQRNEISDVSTGRPERPTLAPVENPCAIKRIEKMPNFTGDDPCGWVAQAEQYFTSQLTPELWRVNIAFTSMKGDALVWLQWMRKQNPTLTWVQLKAELISKFGEDHHHINNTAASPSESIDDGDKGKPPDSVFRGLQETSLADLEVIKVIGKGSIGNVQLVKHKSTQQFFALKVIQLSTEESTCRAISQELRINLSSQCPYIVSCYQSFYHDGLVSIISEFMDCGSLADLLKKVDRVPENILAAICKPVLQGLCYIHHERRIIHRDLKPSSLLINHRGEVKITDFVVSKILTSTSSLANSFVGTYNYMSPERISGSLYGTKSDIWSLGLVLLECATGKFPYTPPEHETEWSSLYELLDAIVENPPPSAPSHLFSPEFCSFISQCIQRDPIDRKSAKELLEHKFVNMFEDSDANLSSYFTDAGTLIPPFAN